MKEEREEKKELYKVDVTLPLITALLAWGGSLYCLLVLIIQYKRTKNFVQKREVLYQKPLENIFFYPWIIGNHLNEYTQRAKKTKEWGYDI